MTRKPKTAQTVRTEAARVLRQCKIKSAPIDVAKVATKLGAVVRYSPFEGELAGMLMRKDGINIIGVNSLHPKNRQRFTIAHEIGHMLLHPGDVHIDRTFRVNRRDKVSSLALDADEIEANRFAAELLMPHELIMGDVDAKDIDLEDEKALQELAEKYEVSLQAMTLRITNIYAEIF